jgi:hypothetical protein
MFHLPMSEFSFWTPEQKKQNWKKQKEKNIQAVLKYIIIFKLQIFKHQIMQIQP